MWERFTDRARRVAVLAQEEARALNHNYVGTEHFLLGLIREDGGIAAAALKGLGLSQEVIRAQVEEIIGRGQVAPSGHIPYTPRAKKVLELSLREALQLGHNYIGTEHILLGLIGEGEGVANQVLVRLGAELTRVRQQVIQVLSPQPTPEERLASTQARYRRAEQVLAAAAEELRNAEKAVKAVPEDPIGTIRLAPDGRVAIRTRQKYCEWTLVELDGGYGDAAPKGYVADWPVIYSPEDQ